MIARGLGRRVSPPFAPAGSAAPRIGPLLATAPGSRVRHRARGPPRNAPAKIARKSRLRAPTMTSPDMLLGQRMDPASPAVNQAPT